MDIVDNHNYTRALFLEWLHWGVYNPGIIDGLLPYAKLHVHTGFSQKTHLLVGQDLRIDEDILGRLHQEGCSIGCQDSQ